MRIAIPHSEYALLCAMHVCIIVSTRVLPIAPLLRAIEHKPEKPPDPFGWEALGLIRESRYGLVSAAIPIP